MKGLRIIIFVALAVLILASCGGSSIWKYAGEGEASFSAVILEKRWDPSATNDWEFVFLVKRTDNNEVGEVLVSGQTYSSFNVGDKINVIP